MNDPIDDLFFDDGDACQGHCTFDSGMCGFLNENTKDDFNWEVVSTLKSILSYSAILVGPQTHRNFETT